MLDWYSNCEPPSREIAIKEVIEQVKKTHEHERLDEICKQVVTDMPSLGSWTGWYVGFRKDAVNAVIEQIRELEKSNSKSISKINVEIVDK